MKPPSFSGSASRARHDAVHQRDGEDHQDHDGEAVEGGAVLDELRVPRKRRMAIAPTSATATIRPSRRLRSTSADPEVEAQQPQRQGRQGEGHEEVGEQGQQQGERGIEPQERGRGGGRDDARRHGAEAESGDQAGPQAERLPHRPDDQRHHDQVGERQHDGEAGSAQQGCNPRPIGARQGQHQQGDGQRPEQRSGGGGDVLEQEPDGQRKGQERGGAPSHAPQNVNDRVH